MNIFEEKNISVRKGVPGHLKNVRSKLFQTFHQNERYNEGLKGYKEKGKCAHFYAI